MRLYPSVATENTIQYNNRSSYFSTGTKEKKIITSDITVIKKYLLTTSIQISRFGSSKCGDFMNDVDVIYCYSLTCNTNAIYCIKNFKVSCPPIRQATHCKRTMMLITDSNRLRWRDDPEIFNTYL